MLSRNWKANSSETLVCASVHVGGNSLAVVRSENTVAHVNSTVLRFCRVADTLDHLDKLTQERLTQFVDSIKQVGVVTANSSLRFALHTCSSFFLLTLPIPPPRSPQS
jgi:hypothetical protein